ncbi:hypothetical protein K461DRAFT_279635 [Myriangium duriaei CBS 260.36]|uniref:Uncharacterized protein n=1 Tax=Myriangium duriaei CBS 260.36 TaxID=1168546 RepID=A0A9P4MJI6_9PEZI|nr:hypothetical protein K461DRAFT_279635 [Myriangium duriaei CBS 260.36]
MHDDVSSQLLQHLAQHSEGSSCMLPPSFVVTISGLVFVYFLVLYTMYEYSHKYFCASV